MTDPKAPGSLALDLTLGDAGLNAALATARAQAVGENWAERAIGRRDPSVWSADDLVQRAVATRLGWLEAPFHFADETGELVAFAQAIRDQGFTTAVLGGMGGSSLAPALLSQVFGTAAGATPVRVLDSTDPAAVAATLDDLDPTRTLFIVSTKSGTTAESLSFQAYQWQRTDAALDAAGVGRPTQPGDFMVAISDPHKSVESIPHHDQLREVFLNPPDVGRAVLRPDLRRPGPGSAARHGSRRAAPAGTRDGGRVREFGPGGQPRPGPGPGDGCLRKERARQADVRDRPRSSPRLGRGSSSSSRRAPARRRSTPRMGEASASSRWTASRSPPSRHTATTASSSESRSPARPGRIGRSARM
jgi:hypothetical protein